MLIRTGRPQGPPQTYWIRTCLFTRFPRWLKHIQVWVPRPQTWKCWRESMYIHTLIPGRCPHEEAESIMSKVAGRTRGGVLGTVAKEGHSCGAHLYLPVRIQAQGLPESPSLPENPELGVFFWWHVHVGHSYPLLFPSSMFSWHTSLTLTAIYFFAECIVSCRTPRLERRDFCLLCSLLFPGDLEVSLGAGRWQ